MTKRIGYGRQAEISQPPKTTEVRKPKLRNPLDKGLESYVRDSQGNCFKAVIAGESFTWIEIEASEFDAANDSKA